MYFWCPLSPLITPLTNRPRVVDASTSLTNVQLSGAVGVTGFKKKRGKRRAKGVGGCTARLSGEGRVHAQSSGSCPWPRTRASWWAGPSFFSWARDETEGNTQRRRSVYGVAERGGGGGRKARCSLSLTVPRVGWGGGRKKKGVKRCSSFPFRVTLREEPVHSHLGALGDGGVHVALEGFLALGRILHLRGEPPREKPHDGNFGVVYQ